MKSVFQLTFFDLNSNCGRTSASIWIIFSPKQRTIYQLNNDVKILALARSKAYQMMQYLRPIRGDFWSKIGVRTTHARAPTHTTQAVKSYKQRTKKSKKSETQKAKERRKSNANERNENKTKTSSAERTNQR